MGQRLSQEWLQQAMCDKQIFVYYGIAREREVKFKKKSKDPARIWTQESGPSDI